MDREHPIPQEVSTYEFRLVGDMTIKQFMQVAAGALISLVLYSSGLAPYVKWPLIIISFLSGVALAFFPIEDRPLSKWIVLFAKAIYSPTIYAWNKNARKYEFFQPENVTLPVQAGTGTAPLPTPETNTPAVELLSANQPTTEDSAGLEKQEQEFLDKVDMQFSSASQTPIASSEDLTQVAAEEVPLVGQPITVPEKQTVNVEQQEKPVTVPVYGQTTDYGGQVTGMAAHDLSKAKSATFSEDASPPSPPTRPNIIVGQVMTDEGKIVDGAILEIKDSEGRSVRALRSNRLGHFMIVTPLANGQYRITTEKTGFVFDPVSFEAKDQIIPPIAIWAKGQ